MAKFKVRITNYSHVEVEAEDWEKALEVFEERYNDPDGPSRELQQEIFDNSTRWFVEFVETVEEDEKVKPKVHKTEPTW